MCDGEIPDRPRATRLECLGPRSLQASDHQVRQAGQEDVKVWEDQATQVEHGFDMQPSQVSCRQVSVGKGEERHTAK